MITLQSVHFAFVMIPLKYWFCSCQNPHAMLALLLPKSPCNARFTLAKIPMQPLQSAFAMIPMQSTHFVFANITVILSEVSTVVRCTMTGFSREVLFIVW